MTQNAEDYMAMLSWEQRALKAEAALVAAAAPALLAENRTLRERVAGLLENGSPGVMHKIDKGFYDLAHKELNLERVRVNNLKGEAKLDARLIEQLRSQLAGCEKALEESQARELSAAALPSRDAAPAELGLPMDGVAQMLGLDIFNYQVHEVYQAIGALQEPVLAAALAAQSGGAASLRGGDAPVGAKFTKAEFHASIAEKLKRDGWIFSDDCFHEDSPEWLAIEAAYAIARPPAAAALPDGVVAAPSMAAATPAPAQDKGASTCAELLQSVRAGLLVRECEIERCCCLLADYVDPAPVTDEESAMNTPLEALVQAACRVLTATPAPASDALLSELGQAYKEADPMLWGVHVGDYDDVLIFEDENGDGYRPNPYHPICQMENLGDDKQEAYAVLIKNSVNAAPALLARVQQAEAEATKWRQLAAEQNNALGQAIAAKEASDAV